MVKYVKDKVMDFWSIFKDDNDYNEKSIIGFISFAIMVIIALTEIIISIFGGELKVSEFIYDSFFWITVSSFAIDEGGKLLRKK